MKPPPCCCQGTVAELSGWPRHSTWLPQCRKSPLPNFTALGPAKLSTLPFCGDFWAGCLFFFLSPAPGAARGSKARAGLCRLSSGCRSLAGRPWTVTLDFAKGDGKQRFCKVPLPGVMQWDAISGVCLTARSACRQNLERAAPPPAKHTHSGG